MHAGILPFKQPRNQSEALFSLPHCAAMALVTGNLTITDIASQSWQRADIKKLIAKISVRSFTADRPELNYDPQQPDRIVIEYADGRQCVDIAYPLGSPQRPLSAQQLRQKFQLKPAWTSRKWITSGRSCRTGRTATIFTVCLPHSPGDEKKRLAPNTGQRTIVSNIRNNCSLTRISVRISVRKTRQKAQSPTQRAP
jgi:hypothetical protein